MVLSHSFRGLRYYWMEYRNIERVKEVSSSSGAWREYLKDGNHRIIVGDFNSKTWRDETVVKLKTVYSE